MPSTGPRFTKNRSYGVDCRGVLSRVRGKREVEEQVPVKRSGPSLKSLNYATGKHRLIKTLE
jgi:hypothetical protein